MIRSWDEADQALHAMAQLDARAERLSSVAEARISEIRRELQVLLDPIERERESLFAALSAWVVEHQGEMVDRRGKPARSIELSGGKVGLRSGAPRLSTSAGGGVTQAELDAMIPVLRARGHGFCIETVERVVRARLDELSDRELSLIGLCRVRTESVFASPITTPAAAPRGAP